MSSKIELLIQSSLKENEASFVADQLMKIWSDDESSDADKNAISVFLIQSGFQETLKNKLLEDISKGKKINWHGLLYFLSQAQLSNEKQDSIYIGLEETGDTEALLEHPNLKVYEKFSKIIQTFIDKRNIKNSEELKKLKEKLQTAIKDKQDQEAIRISNILKTKYFFDKEAQDLTGDVDLADLKKILKRKSSPSLDVKSSIPTKEFKEISSAYLEKAKDIPSEAYNIAIGLYQMEAYAEALTALHYAPDSVGKNWITLNLLIKNKKYIEAIEYSFDIEKKYSEDPNTLSEALYWRALALYELNEKEKAVKILESISAIKPNHLQAKIKLNEWTGGTR